jgi:hypothetical protein
MLSRTSFAPWVRGAPLGAVLGTLCLGIGGRAAMRGIATAQSTTPGFSFGGTLTVVFLGALAGLAAGLVYVATRMLLPRHVGWARALFSVILLAITLRGLRPLDLLRLELFLPLFIVFGLALDRLWERQSHRVQKQSVGVPAA